MPDGDGRPGPTYRLRRPATPADWDAYHAIRREVMFEDDGADDPEERAPGHYPLLLWCGDRPVGTIRIDNLDGEAAAFRLVAIDPAEQGRGHGRAVLREAEAFARDIGCRRAVVYATPEAAGFYAAAGYAEDPFDDNYFGGVVQMTKPLHYAGFSTGGDAAG
jgi:GNAT superfamily N-acetyltransferase